MEDYQALTSWTIFAVACAAAAYYYWPKQQRRPDRFREDAHHAAKRRRNEQDTRLRQGSRTSDAVSDVDQAQTTMVEAGSKASNEGTRKRKMPSRGPLRQTPAVVVQNEEPEEVDMNTKQWAQQMLQARQGTNLSSTKGNEQRVKTMKQSSTLNTPVLSSGSSQAGAEADDDISPEASPSLKAGDVSDMLDPAPSGPMSLRITAPTKPQKEKVVRQPKDESIETKKQRQNRKKVEERRLQQEEDESARKKLEEKQRRTAREARGEPARNGIAAPKPTVSAWATSTPTPGIDASTTPSINGTHDAPLLDTFDVESIGSSNGGMAASTAATSTSSGGAMQWDHDLPSEEDQMAQAMKQSEDESGWTTVAQPKKQQKKKTVNDETNAVEQPILTNKTNLETTKPAANGKPKGFQALEVEYEQRADADPDDAANWDA